MMRLLSRHPPCMEALLTTVLRDRLTGLPILTDHLRWACQMATRASRNPHFHKLHAAPFHHHQAAPTAAATAPTATPAVPPVGGVPALSPSFTAAGDRPAAATAADCLLDEEGQCQRGRHWLHRPMLVKCLIVGQMCPDPRVLQQVGGEGLGFRTRLDPRGRGAGWCSWPQPSPIPPANSYIFIPPRCMTT